MGLPRIPLLLVPVLLSSGSVALADPRCRADGWCWLNPLPQGNSLLDVYAASASDAWAVGDRGTLIHWDGKAWTPADSGVPERLRAIAGHGASDVWAVGDRGVALHFDGTQWRAHPLPAKQPLLDVWVSPTGKAWVVAEGRVAAAGSPGVPGLVARWDGSDWRTLSPADLGFQTVWGSDDRNVWIGGGEKEPLRRWDGVRWTPLPLPDGVSAEGVRVARVRGLSPRDVFVIFSPAAGEGSLDAFAWNGRGWSRLPATFTAAGGVWGLDDLWAPSRSRVWLRSSFSRGPVSPWHLVERGGVWAVERPELSGMDPRRLGGASDDDGWAVGDCGSLAHWNGRGWQVVSHNPAATPPPEPQGPRSVLWYDLTNPRLSGGKLWLTGTWPAPGDSEPVARASFVVDLAAATFASGKAPSLAPLKGCERRSFENGRGDRWELRQVGSSPEGATLVSHSIDGKKQPDVAFPRLEGAWVDERGAFWAWGDCGTVVTDPPASRQGQPAAR